MAGSSARLLALALACSGCDFVFGLTGEPTACELPALDGATAIDIAVADDFSVAWEEDLAVIVQDGPFELQLRSGVLNRIELNTAAPSALALAPEGNLLTFTTAGPGVPLLLAAAKRGAAGSWDSDATPPPGVYAGTPSADAFGPRRVLAMPDAASGTIVEYEDVAGAWTEVATYTLAVARPPNLTPNGLTMVYAGTDAAGAPAVLAAQRATMGDLFGEPVVVRAGALASPQLLGKCERLYAVDSDGTGRVLRRYER